MLERTSSTLLIDLRDPQNSQAWRQFMDRYAPLLVSYARRRGLQLADAEDVAQEVLAAFVAAHREGRYDRERGPFRNWLSRIAAHKTVDAFHRLARRERQAPDGSETAFLEVQQDTRLEGHEQLWQQEWEAFVLESCKQIALVEFDRRTLRAFEMCGFEGQLPEAVARELGMSEEAVYQAKSRVLRRMREVRAELEITM